MSQTLLHEFFRYTYIQRAISTKHEYNNILERWLITASNDYQDDDFDRIIDKRKLKKTYFASKKMIEELASKNFEESLFDKFRKRTIICI